MTTINQLAVSNEQMLRTDAAIIGRVLLRREPTTDEVSKWAPQLSQVNGAKNLVLELIATEEFAAQQLNLRQTTARAYDAMMRRYDPGEPYDIDHWMQRQNLGEDLNHLLDRFASIYKSGYQADPCGSPVDPQQPIKALRDSAGNPLIFTIGNNRHLYLFKYDGNRWQQLDLSEALPTSAHAKVQSFDVRQNEKSGEISFTIAVSPRSGPPTSKLYLATHLSASLDAQGWLDALKNMEVCSGGPDGVVISHVDFGSNDGADLPLVIIGAAVKGTMNNYFFEARYPQHDWEFLRIPLEADTVLHSTPGQYRRPGLWSLYQVGPDVALTFTTLGDRFGKTINISYENLPAHVTTFVVAPGENPRVPDVFVGGDGISVYRSSNQNPETVLTSEQARGTTFLSVSRSEGAEHVWYTDASESLYYVSKLNGGEWGKPESFGPRLKSLAFVGGSMAPSLEVCAVTPSRALELWKCQQPGGSWQSKEIPTSAVWEEVPLTLTELNQAIHGSAPAFYFARDELYQMSSVEFYLKKVGLWSTENNDWQFEKGTLWDSAAGDIREGILQDLPRTAPENPKRNFDYVLKLDDADYRAIQPGHPDGAPVYIHAKFMPSKNCTDLVFWIFCPYNGAGILSIDGDNLDLTPLGIHEGDWEHFTIRVDNDSLEAISVYLSQHDSGGWLPIEQLERDSNNGRDILYSSLHGHAFYTKRGNNKTVFFDHLIVIGLVNHCSEGLRINTYEQGRTQLVSASFLGSDAPAEPRWLSLPWRWGRYFEFSKSDIKSVIENGLNNLEGPILSHIPTTDIVNQVISRVMSEVTKEEGWLGNEDYSVGPQAIKFKDNWFGDEDNIKTTQVESEIDPILEAPDTDNDGSLILDNYPDESLILVLSDIHIGDNSPTVWYQKEIHEKYLVGILEAAKHKAVREVVLLGDLVDFWTYPFDRRPPTFEQIAEANPNVFGPNGALAQLLDAKNGAVYYVVGNHDMGVTAEDVKKIKSPGGHSVRFYDEEYSPEIRGTGKIVMLHGHHYTMFNKFDPESPWNGLPVGHFITRMIATQWSKKLEPGQTVAQLPEQGAPNGINLIGVVQGLISHMGDISLSRALLDSVAKTTGVGKKDKILLPGNAHTNLQKVAAIYTDLWSEWVDSYGGGQVGLQYAAKAALADGLAYYLGFFAQQKAFEENADLVVMGHTHTPISGLNTSLVNYLNSGFECPSTPDMSKQPMSFLLLNVNSLSGEVFRVTENSRDPKKVSIVPYPAKHTSVVAGPSMDFSCYVIIDNSKGSVPLILKDEKIGHGYYVVRPPKNIPAGAKVYIWLQDFTGPHGADAWFEYAAPGKPTQRYTFDCPTGFYSNSCSGGDYFRTKSSDGSWGEPNVIAKKGHPFFVHFHTV